MFVRDIWQPGYASVELGFPAEKALDLFEEFEVESLPVVEEGRVVGIVRAGALYAALRRNPAGGTIPGTVAGYMEEPPAPVHPEDLVEEVAYRMIGQPVNFLPVVDKDGILQGVVSRDALLSEICRLFGLGETNSRFTLLVQDRPGQLARITSIVAQQGGDIAHVLTQESGQPGMALVVLRVAVDSPGSLAKAFMEAGFGVKDVVNFNQGRRIGTLTIT